MFSYTAFLILADNIKTLTFFYYLIKHAKTLKDLEAQAKAILVSRFAELNDQALRNYNTAAKQAPLLTTSALRAHKALTPKID
jgi:hypothetical protein